MRLLKSIEAMGSPPLSQLYYTSLIVALLPSGVAAHPLYYSFLPLSSPELLGSEPRKQRAISSTAVAASTGGHDVLPGNVASTTEGNKVLAVKLICLGSSFFSSTIAALTVEEEHCVFPVIELIADGTSCIPDLLLAHKLAVLDLVTLHRALHVDTCLALVAGQPSVGLLVKLSQRLLDAAAATYLLLWLIV